MAIVFASKHEFPPNSKGGGELTAKELLIDIKLRNNVDINVLTCSKNIEYEQSIYEKLIIHRVDYQEFDNKLENLIKTTVPSFIITYLEGVSNVIRIAEKYNIPIVFLIVDAVSIFSGLSLFNTKPIMVITLSKYLGQIVKKNFHYDYFIYHPKSNCLQNKGVSTEMRFNFKTVGMINPNKIKGGDIFVQIADKLRTLKYICTKGWEYPEEAPSILITNNNIDIKDWQYNISDFYNKLSVLLIPSICPEGFGRVAREAGTIGIPIIASNRGALLESSCNSVIYLDPLNVNEWVKSLHELFSDYNYYKNISSIIRETCVNRDYYDDKIRENTISNIAKIL